MVNNKPVLEEDIAYVASLEEEIKTLRMNNTLLLQALKDSPGKDWYKEIILFLALVAFIEFCGIVTLYFK